MHFSHTLELPALRDAEGGGLGGGGADQSNGAGSDGAAGGFADAGAASASFDGSISANAGDYTGGSPAASDPNAGASAGPIGGFGDLAAGGGGFATTAGDVAAIGVVGGAGAIGGASGALGGTFGLSVLGLSPGQAAVDLSHDMSLGLGIAVAANPSFAMYATSADPAVNAVIEAGYANVDANTWHLAVAGGDVSQMFNL